MRRATYFVRVDLERLAANATQEGEPLTKGQAQLYLQAWGFIPLHGDIWQCNDHSLAYLRANEIESIISA